MALLTNSIGIYQFLGMQGNPIPPASVVSIDERPGVEGSEITDEGKKGRPFTLVTWVDQPNYSAAWLEFRAYQALIAGVPQELVHAGINSLADEGYLVAVLDVRPLQISTIRPGAGGLNPPSQGFVMVEWTLLGIPG